MCFYFVYTKELHSVYPIFSFSRYCQMVFQSDGINLCSYQQCQRVSVALYPCRYFSLAVHFILANLVRVQEHLIIVFIFITLMANKIENLFIYLFAIWYLRSWSIYSNFFLVLLDLIFFYSQKCIAYSEYKPFINYMHVLQIYFPTLWLSIFIS